MLRTTMTAAFAAFLALSMPVYAQNASGLNGAGGAAGGNAATGGGAAAPGAAGNAQTGSDAATSGATGNSGMQGAGAGNEPGTSGAAGNAGTGGNEAAAPGAAGSAGASKEAATPGAAGNTGTQGAGNESATSGGAGNAGTGSTGAGKEAATPGAAGNAGAGNEATGGGTAAEARLGPDQMLFSKMSGAAVYDQQNKDIGDINNVVLDQNGKVAAVVIQSGGFLGLGGKTFAVPMSALQTTASNNDKLRFVVSMSEAQVKTSPSFNLNPPKNTENGSSTAPAGQGNANGSGR